MRVSLFQLKKHHSLFLKLGIETCKEMISHMPLIILDDTQLLYKEGEYVNSAYIVILGKIIMHTTKLGVIGLITIGEFVGEECLIKNNQLKARGENAYSSGLTFVLELTQDFWNQLKDILSLVDCKIDYHRLGKIIESCQVKKKSWRQYKKKYNPISF